MKILLLGEYSNVHWTLAEGLRTLGHEVVVVSNGDFWKNYPRDIDVSRSAGKLGGMALYLKILSLLPRFRGYDIVQIINPQFFELKAERLRFIYKYLRKHNKAMVLGAFGMDYYWVKVCTTTMPLRYSDFNIGKELRANKDAIAEQQGWLGTPKGDFNRFIAHDCDAIVAGLYEYWACYEPIFPMKTTFIPYPIKTKPHQATPYDPTQPVKIFIGISKSRSEYKGTDIMLRAAQDIKRAYPELVELTIANGVPFSEYVKMMNGADLILDQLYSYTPSMNPLEAMSKGIICVGGGEPENYEIIGEKELHPIINVLPNYESCYAELEKIILNRSIITPLKQDSIKYVHKHHNYIKVAQSYETLYYQILTNKN